jgi:hypothetical protein
LLAKLIQTYQVSFDQTTNGFTTTGLQGGSNQVITATYTNGNIYNRKVSLWGAVFRVDQNGFMHFNNIVWGQILARRFPPHPGFDPIGKLLNGNPIMATMSVSFGTLVAGQTYQVVYNPGYNSFTVTGLQGGSNQVITATYDNGNIYQRVISLWGATFHVDQNGTMTGSGMVYGHAQ